MKIVIAENIHQYHDWLAKSGLRSNQAVYVDRDEQLYGMELSVDDVIYVGEHWKNPVSRELLATRIRR